jgi:hypothetical protein
MDPQVIVDRLRRFVLRLDTGVFEEMRDDPNATIPALVVAGICFFLAGFGGWLWWAVEGYGDKAKIFWQSTLLGSLFAFGLWLAWIAVAWLLLVNVWHYTANLERMIRSCAFATLPLALGIFILIPWFNLGIGLAVFALFFLLMDIGIQVSVDAPPGQVIIATFAGFLVFSLVLSLLVQTDTALAPNIFLFRVPANALSDISNAFNAPRTPTNFQIPTIPR